MAVLLKPDVPAGPVRVLFGELHDLHHRAGWPSLRDIARQVGCSRTTVSRAFSEPAVPRWGLLELIVETLGGQVERFHRLWLAASQAQDGLPAGEEPAAAALPRAFLPRQLPADVFGFTGRAEQLTELDGLLARDGGRGAVVICAVVGMAGVGKTALVKPAPQRTG